MLSKRIPNPLKLSIQGHPGEMRQAGLRDGRPRCPGPSLGNGPRLLPKEKSRSSRRRILCSHLHASTPTSSEHNPKFPASKKLPDCLPSDLFSLELQQMFEHSNIIRLRFSRTNFFYERTFVGARWSIFGSHIAERSFGLARGSPADACHVPESSSEISKEAVT